MAGIIFMGDRPLSFAKCIVSILVATSYLLNFCLVEGMEKSELKNSRKHQGIVIKTMKGKEGDDIDCVNIFKQPAFDLPILKNHTIQMKPGFHPNEYVTRNFTSNFSNCWGKSLKCPKGTVPIVRSSEEHNYNKWLIKKPMADDDNNYVHEYARVKARRGDYFGASATVNVWNPHVENIPEFSLAQIWVVAGVGKQLNTIEVGWMVNPQRNGNTQTRLFIYWTRDGYKTTGCYNLECPGFVQVSEKVPIGMPMETSSYGSQQKEFNMNIFKDTTSGNWWFKLDNEFVGYWPASTFTHLARCADKIDWGGEIINYGQNNRHTSTHMGSGRFPREGYGKAAYFHSLRIMNEDGSYKDPLVTIGVTKEECYDLVFGAWSESRRKNFFYGGPGYSENCL